MNRVELDQAAEAVHRRVRAAMRRDGCDLQLRDQAVSVFAGTDLPGHAVLEMLDDDIAAHEHRVVEVGVISVLQGVSLNAFLLGFECGRRSS